MTFLVTAWTGHYTKIVHQQHLMTLAAVNRLMHRLVEQTDVSYITIRLFAPNTTYQLPMSDP